MPGPAFRRGETVALHPITEDDLGFLQRNWNDPAVRSGMTTAFPETRTETEENHETYSEDESSESLLIVPRDAEAPVGTVIAFDIDPTHGTAELAAWVAPDAQGEGYATEGTRLLLGYLFDERRLAKVVARALVTNGASRSVLEKLGFRTEAIQREEKFVDGEHVDVARYTMLAREWAEGGEA
jgi:RimJ/RimL family protein N-acetyltransferase